VVAAYLINSSCALYERHASYHVRTLLEYTQAALMVLYKEPTTDLPYRAVVDLGAGDPKVSP
jgi:hypothetical protein